MSENKGLFDDGSDEGKYFDLADLLCVEYKPVELDQQPVAGQETSNPYGEDQN